MAMGADLGGAYTDSTNIHQSLPVAGYKPQPSSNVDMVNLNKECEERILRVLDTMAGDQMIDQRWLAIGRTQMEQAWMSINRSIFRPTRVALPND